MALRSPIYLDAETLFAQAQYHDIEVPQQADIVERTLRKRTGGGRVAFAGVGVDASRGTDVEFQSSYTLEPRQKASVSKTIDALIAAGAVQTQVSADTVLTKDAMVEVEGITQMTSASLVGKLFFMMRRLLADGDGNLDEVLALPADAPQVLEQMKRIYLQNELLPLPILLKMNGTGLEVDAYVNVRPAHFIDSASINRIEGDVRVLATVTRLVSGGKDGYFSTEEWLLHDWEYLLRRLAMTRMDELEGIFDGLNLGLPTADVHQFISGPAVVLDAIAVY
ncbi:MAG: hypothetical protein L0H79_14980 [Intrasporangium sp.]|uniref:hypothetical protein n=1 Tax=Intrasporangium sp. TaxID=1925024 RepID=UPI00264717CF|nr:hypothetical protein [Intrasporangium sp.]MDN5797044.1 hypothetical protein [Intrasporangium sp.]